MTVDGQYGSCVTCSCPDVMGSGTEAPSLSFFTFWGIAGWELAGHATALLLLTHAAILLARRRSA